MIGGRDLVELLAHRAAWAAVGAVALYAAIPTHKGPTYDHVVVPAARIVEREVPGPERLKDRVVYRYIPALQVASAPAGAQLQVQSFCAPTVAVAAGDTTAAKLPHVELVRSVVHSSSWLPFRRGSLLVTSVDGVGDLFARDYPVRDDFGVGSGDSVVVRYGRLAWAKEAGRGVLWAGIVWGTVKLARAVIGR